MNVRSSPAKSAVDAAAEYAKNFSAAVSMEKTRRLFEARQLYLAAVKAKPGDGAARERLIGGLLHISELAAADEEAQAALALAPNEVTLLNMLGVIQKRRGRF